MLSHQIHFSIEGEFDSGFLVHIHCFDSDHRLIAVDRGQLPANSQLMQMYQKWKALYLRWGRSFRLEPILNEPNNVSFLEMVQNAAAVLAQEMNQWLEADCFASIRTLLEQQLSTPHPTHLILQTQSLQLQRLPWPCWTLFEQFPGVSMALAPTCYVSGEQRVSATPVSSIRLLAVLTGGDELDTQGDRQLLEKLPKTCLDVFAIAYPS